MTSPTVSWRSSSPHPTWRLSRRPCVRPTPGTSALEGTHPYLGTPGQVSQEAELKVEVTCRTEEVDQIIAAVKAVHPYEEPVINAIPLFRTSF